MKVECLTGPELGPFRSLVLAPPGSRLHNQNLFETAVLARSSYRLLGSRLPDCVRTRVDHPKALGKAAASYRAPWIVGIFRVFVECGCLLLPSPVRNCRRHRVFEKSKSLVRDFCTRTSREQVVSSFLRVKPPQSHLLCHCRNEMGGNLSESKPEVCLCQMLSLFVCR
jgi:hypothetical protein